MRNHIFYNWSNLFIIQYLTANKTIGGSSSVMAVYAFFAGQGSGWVYIFTIYY